MLKPSSCLNNKRTNVLCNVLIIFFISQEYQMFEEPLVDEVNEERILSEEVSIASDTVIHYLIQIHAILKKNFDNYIETGQCVYEIVGVIFGLVFFVILKEIQGKEFKNIFGLIFLLLNMIICRQMAYNFYFEKQSKMKQLQYISGVSAKSFYIGWILYTLVNTIILVSAFLVFQLIVFSVLGLQLYVIERGILPLGLYIFSSLAFSLFITSCFRRFQTISGILILFFYLGFILLDTVKKYEEVGYSSKFNIFLANVVYLFNPLVVYCLCVNNPTGDNSPMNFIELNKHEDLVNFGQTFVYLALFIIVQYCQHQSALKKIKFNIMDQQNRFENNKKVELNELQGTSRTRNKLNPELKIMFVNKEGSEEIQLSQGNIYCILGLNRSGKSTLLKKIAGIDHQQLSHVNIYRNKAMSIGFCHEQCILYPDLTVEQHLRFFARIRLSNKRTNHLDSTSIFQKINLEVQTIINDFQLNNQRFKQALALSGGNMKKLCLAIAFIGSPSLIILDDPTEGLDQIVKEKLIQKIIHSKKHKNCIIIMAMPDLRGIEKLIALSEVETHYIKQFCESNDKKFKKLPKILSNMEFYVKIMIENQKEYLKMLENVSKFIKSFYNQQKENSSQSKSKNYEVKSYISASNSKQFQLNSKSQELKIKQNASKSNIKQNSSFSSHSNKKIKFLNSMIVASPPKLIQIKIDYTNISSFIQFLNEISSEDKLQRQKKFTIDICPLEKDNITTRIYWEDSLLQNQQQQENNIDLQKRKQTTILFQKQFVAVFSKRFIAYKANASNFIMQPLIFIFTILLFLKIDSEANFLEQCGQFEESKLQCQKNNLHKHYTILSNVAIYISYYFICSLSIWYHLLKDKMLKFTYVSQMMGLNRVTYWLSNFVFDVLLLIHPIILFLLLFLTPFFSNLYTDSYKIWWMLATFSLMAFSFVSLVYILSLTIQREIGVIHTSFLTMACFMYWIPMEIAKIFPRFIQGLQYINLFQTLKASFRTECFLDGPKLIEFEKKYYQISFGDLQYQQLCLLFLMQTVICFILFQCVDSLNCHKPPKFEGQLQDSADLVDERRIIESLIKNGEEVNMPLIVQNVFKKVYVEYNFFKDIIFKLKNITSSIRNAPRKSKKHFTLRDINILIESQLMYGLLGKNGSGKSTIYRLITQALHKDSGSIRYFGKTISNLFYKEYLKIGLFTQFDYFLPFMTIEDHLKYFCMIKGLAWNDQRQQIMKIIRFFYRQKNNEGQLNDKISKTLKKYSLNLSKSERILFKLVISMMGKQQLLFLDEPTTGLDQQNHNKFWTVLSHLKQSEKFAVMITSHDYQEIQMHCDRVGILSDGAMRFINTPINIINQFEINNVTVFIEYASVFDSHKIKGQIKDFFIINEIDPQVLSTSQGKCRIKITIPGWKYHEAKAFVFLQGLVRQKIILLFEKYEYRLKDTFNYIENYENKKNLENSLKYTKHDELYGHIKLKNQG